MSWFDTAGLTSLAKSALKEAQRTIDKALDIEENNENAEPATSHKGISEKLKDESENFFASFGIEKKKSPLTPANTPVEPVSGSKDGGDKASSGAMVGSLWGSFTGSFFDNASAGKKQVQADAPETLSASQKSIVATQPPRSSTSLPSLQLPKSPVSTQPRTSSLEDYPIDKTESQKTDGGEIDDDPQTKEVPEGGKGSDQNEWGWGWESSIMVMSGDQQQLEGDLNSSQADLEGREDSLVDDDDEDGFARSRLVVGSVDSDGFARQESQGSLCGRSVDLDVPSVISEDVFDSGVVDPDSLNENTSSQSTSDVKSFSEDTLVSEKRTTVSCGTSEVNTPDSIVLLTSDSSPEAEVPELGISASDTHKLSVNLSGSAAASPISSPDSIEVLGSSSLVTSPSSIEVLSGMSSSDSSPSHQDSCSITLTEDRCPSTMNYQPITRPPYKHDSEVQFSQPGASQDGGTSDRSTFEKESEWKLADAEGSSNVVQKAVVKQPTHWDKEELVYSKDSDASAQSGINLLEDLSSESMHSTSTSSTHTVLDSSTIISASEVFALSGSPEPQSLEENRHHTSEAGLKNDEDGEVSESRTESDIPGLSLDISVESGGSSDTITASLDSSQMAMSCKSHVTVGENDEDQRDLQETSMSTSGGSVVRCLLEEAMGDEEAVSINSPPEREHSPSSSERSEALKVGSGHTSGQSSGDEIETTTSSDIEVISSPSLDGSTVPRGSAAASRVWASAQRGLRSFLNDRSESPASDSSSNNKKSNADKAETIPSSMTTSFTSISESEGESSNLLVLGNLTLDPSSISQVLLQDLTYSEKGHRRNQSNFSETSESSSEPLSPEMDKLLKKVSQLSEVLEARETKLMELSQVNAALQDTNLRMKTRIEELEGGVSIDATETLREEFTQRLVTMERKFQQALREKEAIKKQLEEVRAEAATRLSSAEVAREREEKDIVIRELREEGEKLSKQQLSYSNIVKKLRSKEKENETTIKTQKDKLEEQSRELERLRKQLSAKEEVERRQIDAVCQLNVNNQRLEQMVKDTGAENAELEGKMSALKNALDTAYREMNELQRAAATKDAEAQEQALSAEVEIRKQVEAKLEEVQTQARREQEGLMAQVVELQDSLTRAETQTNRKERQLRADISELQQRLSEAEARAEELSGAVSSATRPLLRQMENLQSTHTIQQSTWESLELTLTRRLNEAQTAAAASSEKERATREQYAQIAANAATLQTQVANLRAENSRLSSQVDILTSKLDTLSEIRSKENTQIAALKASFAEEIGEVKRERDSFEQQLDIEKTAVAAEKKKSHSLQEQLKERDRKLLQISTGMTESHASTPRSSPTPSLSRISVSGSLNESFTGSQWGDEVFESNWSRGTSLYDSMRGNTTATVDALTSQLRQREGEVHHLHSEITRFEAQRESLAQELVSVTTQLDTLQTQLEDFEALQQQYKDMEQKYNALLQMHGEKVEEVEELRLDLADVKEMYKAQIDQLLQK